MNFTNPCSVTGVFDEESSSTFKRVDGDFSIEYVDKQYAKGTYGSDVFGIGGIQVENLVFGIGMNTTSPQGIMGIGYPEAEAISSYNGAKRYNNLPDLLVKQGFINTRAYSLWLNDLDASTGELLFGAVDTAKYRGALHTVPLVHRSSLHSSSKPHSFYISLTNLTMTNTLGEMYTNLLHHKSLPALLDSGTSYIYLPPTMARSIIAAAKASYYGEDAQQPVIPCAARNLNATINFSFSGVTIPVPLEELILDAHDKNGNPAQFSNGTPLCYFTVLEGDENPVLGDTFLRSAYVVYDLDNHRIALAPTRFNATASNIVEITAGPDGIPKDVSSEDISGTMLTEGQSSGTPATSAKKGAGSGFRPDVSAVYSLVLALLLGLVFAA